MSSAKGILEIALDYGYESQASFTKAFSRLHGLTPGAARQGNQVLKAFPPISFHLSIKGGITMDYEIKELPAFQVVGKMITASNENGENFTVIPKFWQKVMNDGSFNAIMKLSNEAGFTRGAPMGICIDFTDDSTRFNYLVACESTLEKAPQGMVIKTIPAHQWAVFKTQGPLPDSIQLLWNRIFSEWFPATQYNHAKGPELEIYPPSADDDPKNCLSEVWIPIEK